MAFGAVSNPEQAAQIWLHSLNSSAVRRLSGTDGASHPCWSPDGRSIAFTAFGKLMRYDLQKREWREHLTQAEALGVSWSAEGGILFARGQGHGLSRISPAGGAPDAQTTLDAAREETVHAWPQWLPDGRSFIYLALSRQPQQSGVYLARVGDSARRLVLAGGYRAMYAEPGVLLYKKRFPAGGAAFSAAGWDAARHAVGRRLRCLLARSRRRGRCRRVARRRPRVRRPGPPSQPRADVGRSRRPAARDTEPRRSLRGFCALAGRTVRRAPAHDTRDRAARSRSVDAGSVRGASGRD